MVVSVVIGCPCWALFGGSVMEPTVTIQGRLGDDPKTVTFPSGDEVVEFSVAVSSIPPNGETKSARTTWYTVQVGNGNRVHAARVLAKGVPVSVTGILSAPTYERQDGSKGTTLRLRAQSVAIECFAIESFTQPARREAAVSGDAAAEIAELKAQLAKMAAAVDTFSDDPLA